MLVLLKKEIRNFFSSATGFVVIGLFLILTGCFLWILPGENNVLDSGYASLDGLFALAPWLYMFLVPAITMRFFAEEKRAGTMELLFTRPLGIMQIVAAKYFAGLLLVIFSLLPTLVYLVSVYWLGNPVGNVDLGGFWGSFIGLGFLAAVYVSVGLFASSVTDNQIISFLIGALLCFFMYYGFDLLVLFFSNATIQDFISMFGISYHYDSMSRGVIDTRDVVYFITVSLVFVYATGFCIAKRR